MSALTSGKPVAFINVQDRERARAFYADRLGVKHVASDEHGELFRCGDTSLRITAMADHRPSAHPVFGWEVRDLVSAVRELTTQGIDFLVYDGFGQDADAIWSDPSGMVKIAWFNDPDENVLSLSQA